MSDEFIPLARPAIGAREEELVLDVLRSRHLSLGPRLAEFEEAVATRVGAPHVSAVSSGTAGLHLALRAAGIEAGDEVTPFYDPMIAKVIAHGHVAELPDKPVP